VVCVQVVAQNAASVVQAGPALLGAVVTMHTLGFLFGCVPQPLTLSSRSKDLTELCLGAVHAGTWCPGPWASPSRWPGR
jgi:hypothetical protein